MKKKEVNRLLYMTINVYLLQSADADVKQNDFRLHFGPYGHIMFRKRIMTTRDISGHYADKPTETKKDTGYMLSVPSGKWTHKSVTYMYAFY